jgi:hypothetical protein
MTGFMLTLAMLLQQNIAAATKSERPDRGPRCYVSGVARIAQSRIKSSSGKYQGRSGFVFRLRQCADV